MFPKTFIFQATIKGKKTKTISDCRKYRICLSILSLHFHICTVVKEQDMYTEF